MAKKSPPATTHKVGDTVTGSDGITYRYTTGGHWRDDKTGKLYNNGSGDPTPSTPQDSLGNDNYLSALDAISGGSYGSDIKKVQAQVSDDPAKIARGEAISQGQADAEISRLKGLATKNSSNLSQGLSDLAGGDAGIEKGFKGGAELANTLFAPGSLGRVDETASQDQLDIQSRLKDLSGPNVDPILQASLDRAEKTADAAQTLSPELQNVLDIRKSALSGLSSDQLLATKELAQSGYDQSLTSAVRALRVGQGGNGPRGAASNIGTIPLTAQYAQSQADLSRKLILDQYNAQTEARNAYATDAENIIGGFEKNRIDANTAAQSAEQGVIQDRTSRFNNYVNYNTALRNDLYGRRLQNLNTIAAEKSGQAATIFGGGSFAAAQEGQQQQFELGKENLALQKDIYKSSQSSGGGGDDTTSPGDGNEDTFG